MPPNTNTSCKGLILLKYISDSFEEHFAKLQAGVGKYAGADPEAKDEYKAENVFFVPSEARWSFLQSHAKQPEIGTFVDEAMDLRLLNVQSVRFVASILSALISSLI